MQEQTEQDLFLEIKWIPICTYRYGWNVEENRPALKDEQVFYPEWVCMCEYCAGGNCHYGPHYCKRFNETHNGQFYSDHKERWNAGS